METLNILKNKVKQKYSEYIIASIILLIFIIALLFEFKRQYKQFTFWSDQYYQFDIFYEYFYHSLVNAFKEKTIPMYSWYSFLGNNFIGNNIYYCIGDIFNPILFLLYCVGANISVLLRAESTLCLFISAWTMILFLKSKGIKQRSTIILISIAYACGGFATYFYGQYMFHRFYAFLPLLYFSIEKFLEGKSGILFSFIVFLLFLQNYYLMVPVSISLIFYCLFSFKNHNKLKAIFILKLIGYYFIGVLLSSFLIVPAFIVVSNNTRLGATNTFGLYHGYLFFDFRTYLEMIRGLLINSPYGSSPSQIPWDYYNLRSLSGFIGFIPLVASFCEIIKNFKKNLWLIVFIILSIVPVVNSMIHGFSDPSFRWLFICDFYLLCIAGEYLDHEYNKKRFIVVSIIIALIFIIAVVYSLKAGFIENSGSYFELMKDGIILSALTIVLLFVGEKYAIYFTILVILVYFGKCELYSAAGYGLYQTDYYGKNNFSYINDIEPNELFRIYVDPKNYGGNKIAQYNESLKYDFMSVQSYDTFTDPAITDFLLFIDENDNTKKVESQELRRLLGVKYIITDENLESEDFIYIMNMNNYKVFKDNKANSIGYSYFAIQKDTSKFDQLIDLNNSSKYIINNQIDFSEKGINYFIGNVSLEKESNIIITLPNNKGWKMLIDGVATKPDTVFGGFVGFKLDKGDHIIEGYYVTPGLKTGILLSFVGFAIMALLIRKKKLA